MVKVVVCVIWQNGHVVHCNAVAGLVVAAMIAKMGLQFGVDSVRELTDEAVDAKLLQDVGAVVRDACSE